MLKEFPTSPGGYSFARRLVRAWLDWIHGKIRLLRREAMPASGPVILVASSPASLRQALVLVAALGRPVSCLIERTHLRGFFAGWISRKLGMIPYEPTKDGMVAALKAARARLEQGEAVAILASETARGPGEPSMGAQMAATLALSTAPRLAGKPLAFLPAHILLPIARSPRREVLICLSAAHLLDVASLPAERAPATRQIAVELSRALHENPFCLPPQDVETVLKDLEQVLRAELEEDWARRADWKQKVDGFGLSRFVADWLEQLGAADPGRLIAWRHELDAYREELRRWSLRQAEVEAAGGWVRSPLGRAWYWLECMAGFPVALYGLLNHLLAGAVLYASRLLKKQSSRDRRAEWALRAAIVLGCYLAQTLLCAHWWGRAAAGYYALTLPVSGAFFWRYWWLLRARTRLLLLSLRLPARGAALRDRRRKLIAELNAARDRYAETSLSLGSP